MAAQDLPDPGTGVDTYASGVYEARSHEAHALRAWERSVTDAVGNQRYHPHLTLCCFYFRVSFGRVALLNA